MSVNIQHDSVDFYFAEHHRVSSFPNSRTTYTDDEKYEAVCCYQSSRMPISVISSKYHVSKRTFYNWISKFAGVKPSSFKTATDVKPLNSTPMQKKAQKVQETPEEELARLRKENKRLEEALQMAEWMNHAKDVMIDEAEKTFNIAIRKKSGAKQ